MFLIVLPRRPDGGTLSLSSLGAGKSAAAPSMGRHFFAGQP